MGSMSFNLVLTLMVTTGWHTVVSNRLIKPAWGALLETDEAVEATEGTEDNAAHKKVEEGKVAEVAENSEDYAADKEVEEGRAIPTVHAKHRRAPEGVRRVPRMRAAEAPDSAQDKGSRSIFSMGRKSSFGRRPILKSLLQAAEAPTGAEDEDSQSLLKNRPKSLDQGPILKSLQQAVKTLEVAKDVDKIEEGRAIPTVYAKHRRVPEGVWRAKSLDGARMPRMRTVKALDGAKGQSLFISGPKSLDQGPILKSLQRGFKALKGANDESVEEKFEEAEARQMKTTKNIPIMNARRLQTWWQTPAVAAAKALNYATRRAEAALAVAEHVQRKLTAATVEAKTKPEDKKALLALSAAQKEAMEAQEEVFATEEALKLLKLRCAAIPPANFSY